jgi:hypothetical protein
MRRVNASTLKCCLPYEEIPRSFYFSKNSRASSSRTTFSFMTVILNGGLPSSCFERSMFLFVDARYMVSQPSCSFHRISYLKRPFGPTQASQPTRLMEHVLPSMRLGCRPRHSTKVNVSRHSKYDNHRSRSCPSSWGTKKLQAESSAKFFTPDGIFVNSKLPAGSIVARGTFWVRFPLVSSLL